MFPPWGLFFVFLRLMLGLPLRIFPLPFLALKKGLYLREQDAGQGLDLMGRDARSVVVWFFLAHRSCPVIGRSRQRGTPETPCRPR